MWDSPLYYHNTRYCAILQELVSNEAVSNIYIVKDDFSEDDLKYIRNIFGDQCNTKVGAIKGTYMEALKDHPDITFLMIRDDRLLVKAINDGSMDKIDEICILISATSCNIDKDQNGMVQFKNKDLFNNAGNIYVYTTYLYPIKEEKAENVG